MDNSKISNPKYLGLKPLEYYENKIMKLKKGTMWTKDHRINYPTGDEDPFDDFFKITNKKYRVFKFTVWKIVSNSYICGLKFYYQNIEDLADIVEGFTMGPSDLFTNKDYSFQTFKLKPNEYIIELFGKKGLIINNFSVRTNLNNNYGFGGPLGDDFCFKAPKGYFLTCFGGLYSPGQLSISSFSVEVREMAQDDGEKKHREDSYSLKSYKPAFRKLIEFLTISEVTKLFRLNKDFANFRYDSYVLTQIGCKCIYSGSPNLIKYIQKVTKYNHYHHNNNNNNNKDNDNNDNDRLEFQRVYNYLNLTANFNSNPDGQYDFSGYQIVEDGGDRIVVQKSEKESNFITSYSWSTLLWEKTFAELLDDRQKYNCAEVISKIQVAQYAIVVGASICEQGFGASARLKLEILDSQSEILFSDEKQINDLTREYKFYHLKYIQTLPLQIPHSIKFYVSGKDNCFWAGHYGSKFKTITMKIIPIETEYEQTLYQKYIN